MVLQPMATTCSGDQLIRGLIHAYPRQQRRGFLLPEQAGTLKAVTSDPRPTTPALPCS